MATQKCPKCNSDRIRQGYRPTSLLMKLMFRYNLLCNQCNWEFRGFAIPGTVSTKTKRRKSPSGTTRLKNTEPTNELENALENLDETNSSSESGFGEIEKVSINNIEGGTHYSQTRARIRKKVKVRFTSN